MIEVENLSHAFDGQPVLKQINVTIRESRTVIIGANGSGKTTFVRLLNGLILPDVGIVRIANRSTAEDRRHARRRVGLVFQNPDTQIVMPTVSEDLAFGLENMRCPKTEIKKKVEECLQIHGLFEKRDHPAHLLSGGEKKLLTILSVLIMKPDVIVFDEPFAFLDYANKTRIRNLIKTLPQSVIMITHDLDGLENYDRALLFEKGAITADGVPSQVTAAYLDRVRT